MTSSDISLIAAVCAEPVPDPAFVFAGRDLEELQRYQQVREHGSDGSVECSLGAVSRVLGGNPLIHTFNFILLKGRCVLNN